jgi:formyl-CoA transferase
MGAEVIKIEAPGHLDPLRDWGHARFRGRSLLWAVQSRNKKCVTLDLHAAKGQELFRSLADKADVLIENFRPGTLERWQLGPSELWARNPGLVIARVSGYGQTGPYRSRPGFASVAEAMGGLRYVNGYPDTPPPRTGISLGDSLAGMFATIGILAALRHRDGPGNGQGQVVDVSLMESCFALLEGAVPEYDRLGIVREPSGTKLKGVAPSNIFRSADGHWVVIAANSDRVFRRLCEAMGKPELADDPRFATHLARGERQDELDEIIAEWALTQKASDMDTALNAAGVVSGPIYSVKEIFDDPHYRAREMLVTYTDPELGEYVGPGLVPKFSLTPGTIEWSGPAAAGIHNEEIFGLLGLSATEIAELHRDGVL